jgi:hypothetical protein
MGVRDATPTRPAPDVQSHREREKRERRGREEGEKRESASWKVDFAFYTTIT